MKATKAKMVAEDTSTPARTSSQPVAVVPMLAPMIMPIAFDSFIMPELTKPTTMTVDAEEDWMAAVTTVPKRTPFRVVEVPRTVTVQVAFRS